MVVERQVGKKVFQVGCSIVINSDTHFSNYFYYFKTLYTRASNKNMSLIFFKEETVLHYMVHGACFEFTTGKKTKTPSIYMHSPLVDLQ